MRRLNVHRLKKSLNHLCKELDESFLINYGGCCYLSYLLALYFDRLKLKYKLVIFSDTIKSINKITEEIFSKNKNTLERDTVVSIGTCNHYTLYLEGGGILNAEGFRKRCRRYFIEDVTSKNILWIYRKGDWNSEYDVQNNKRVRETIKVFFNKYEKNLSNLYGLPKMWQKM